jgi:putative restriction endonuclease
VRNTAVGNHVKGLYGHACQICGVVLATPGGPYAECCHVRPLGRPHDGPDSLDNVLCLCPNHHAQFDMGGLHVSDDLVVIETGQPLRMVPGHVLGLEHIRYHRGPAG